MPNQAAMTGEQSDNPEITGAPAPPADAEAPPAPADAAADGEAPADGVAPADGEAPPDQADAEPPAEPAEPPPPVSAFPPDAAVGVLRPDDTIEWVFEIGEPVPAPRRRVECHTAGALAKTSPDAAVRFPIVRGSGRVRHEVVGAAVIHASQLSADLPAGSRVKLGIRLDESHSPAVSAYVPATGDTLDDVLELGFRAAFPEGRPAPSPPGPSRPNEAHEAFAED